MCNDFVIGMWKWILYVINDFLSHDLYGVYNMEALITLNDLV